MKFPTFQLVGLRARSEPSRVSSGDQEGRGVRDWEIRQNEKRKGKAGGSHPGGHESLGADAPVGLRYDRARQFSVLALGVGEMAPSVKGLLCPHGDNLNAILRNHSKQTSPGTVAHICNPSAWDGDRQIPGAP